MTSVALYILCLSLSALFFGIKWLVVNKLQKRRENNFSEGEGSRSFRFRKGFRDFFRQLLLGDSIVSKIFVTLNLVCNLVYLGLAISRSTTPVEAEVDFLLGDRPLLIVELVVVAEMLFFALVRFIACRNIVMYWFNIHTLVDVFTLPHIFVSIAFKVDWIGLRTLRFVWLTQFTTVLQFIPFVNHTAMDGVSVLVYFVILWLMSSGILHLLESQGDPWDNFKNPQCKPFFLYAYLVMVTVSTVGYGDENPETTLGRIFTTFFIIAGLAFFAAMLPRLVDITTSYYHRSQFASFDTSRVPQHVIVCGHITNLTAEDFLKDFLHPDRGDNKTHVLFLDSGKPDVKLRNVIRSYYTRVQYLDGSVLNSSDLEKAKIKTARAVFILANKNTYNPTEEDHANLFRLVSVKNTIITVPVIIQLLHSFSKKQVYNIDGWNRLQDVALCLNEMKLGLLAQSCLCPGFSTLIANLFYTSDFVIRSQESDNKGLSWYELYIKGASNEIYTSRFSDSFFGQDFHQAARICFREFKLLLVAIEHKGRLYVNPSSTTRPVQSIGESTNGYFIAQNQEQVNVVEAYNPDKSSSFLFNTSLRIAGSIRRSRRSFHRHSRMDAESANSRIDEQRERTSSQASNYNRSSRKELYTNRSSHNSSHSIDTINRFGQFNETNEDSKFHMYVSEPNQLVKAILNPEVAFLDMTIAQPLVSIADHIVVCLFANGNSPLLGLHSFLNPLRNKRLPPESVKPVVIVSDKAFMEKEWAIIRNIPNVYVVVGSPLRWPNLKSAKITKAAVCVILTVPSGSANDEHGINDKEPILCTLSLKNAKKINKCNANVQILTDLLQESNVQFLDIGDDDEPDERIYKAQPFACGEAFSASMFDSVTSSVFHSPGIMQLVESLIYPSGNTSLCKPLQIANTNFSNMRFADFYESQLDKGSICLGLSRKLSEESTQRFVITSPDPNLILKDTDSAFVITG